GAPSSRCCSTASIRPPQRRSLKRMKKSVSRRTVDASAAMTASEPTIGVDAEFVAEPPSPPPTLDWCPALDDRIAERWDALWQTLPRALDPKDAEGVHDLRVASRRLRAALTVGRACHHGKAYARRERIAKTITRALGAVRDGEVQRGLLRERQAATAGAVERD